MESENTKEQTKYNKDRLIDTEHRLVVTRGEGSWRVDRMGEGDQLYCDELQLDLWW